MNGEVAQQAARRLSVDVANMSYRLAMLDAGRDSLMALVENIDPNMWQRRMAYPEGHEEEATRSEVVLTEEQAEAVIALIALVHDLL